MLRAPLARVQDCYTRATAANSQPRRTAAASTPSGESDSKSEERLGLELAPSDPFQKIVRNEGDEMSKAYSLLIVTAACLILALPAGARADGSYNGPGSSACGAGPFNGLYIGANIGYADADASQTTFGLEIDGDDSSFTGGAQLGYNRQCGNLLFGIETDINAVDLNSQAAYPGPVYTTSSIDWFGTLRGRLGYVHDDRLVVYVTGGLAYADLDHHLYDPTPPGGGPPFSQTDGGLETGWTVGGGIEWLRHANWSLRAEALYVDLGSQNHQYIISQTACGGFVCRSNTDWDDSFWVARLGLNYRFGPEPQAPPLK